MALGPDASPFWSCPLAALLKPSLFSAAAIARGWTLLRVFFFAEGTLLATSEAEIAPWRELRQQARSGDLWVCATSLTRRGGGAPAAGVKAGGLVQLAEMANETDLILPFH